MVVPRKTLKNKPLLEAIFELHWQSKDGSAELNAAYPLWLGSFYNAVKSKYGFHEPLAGYGLPNELFGSVICNRFRAADGEWPLVQLGPQIATLNDIHGYSWDDTFYQGIVDLIDAIQSTHPFADHIDLARLVLRYIDAVDIDMPGHDVIGFIKKHFGISLDMNPDLFLDSSLGGSPLSADIAIEFPCSSPKGSLKLRFSNGNGQRSSTLIWETLFVSEFDRLALSAEGIASWALQAHERTSGSFFNLIDEDLSRRFD
jgi:uncharacterized protein (TIGR04255 family)